MRCAVGEDERRALRAAGFQIFEEMENAQQVRPLLRLREAVKEQRADGNFVTVFGMICAMFNLSLAACLTAYLYCEWRSGVASLANLDFRVTEDGFQEFARSARPAICLAMKPNLEAGDTMQPSAGIVE
jgi:urease accessory protein UreF